MEISINHIHKEFKKHKALNDINLNISSGDLLGVLGVNGAGKTTLLRILTGILEPSSGTIEFDNHSVTSDMIINFVGYLPEERGLYKKMTAIDSIQFLGSLKGLSSSEIKNHIKIKSVDLEIDFDLNNPVGSFSKGMQQKIQLIAATIHKPQILILDEPFSGLDPLNSQVIKKEIKNLSAQGTTILMSTHRMDTFEDLCNTFVFLKNGQILAQGPKEDLIPNQDKYEIATKSPFHFNDYNIECTEIKNGAFVYRINNITDPNELLSRCIQSKIELVYFSPISETLEDVFVKLNKDFDEK